MAMIVYSGDIPLLFWHLNLSADSVGQPERGTLEAQGDEKIDQGDEEARKGENIFKKNILTFWTAGALCDADPAQVAAVAEGDDGDKREEDVWDEGEDNFGSKRKDCEFEGGKYDSDGTCW